MEQNGRKNKMAQEKIAERIFDSVVKSYDAFLSSVTFGLINKWQSILVDNTPVGKISVDLGTGTGEVIKKIKKTNPEVFTIGVDVSQNMLLKAKEKLKDTNTALVKASAYKMPFKNDSVDSILMSLVFRHLDAEKAIPEFSRVLKKGGYVSILDISKPHKIIFNSIFFFADRIFRPLGQRIFTKEEYDYFMESVLNSRKPEELEALFKKYSFKKEYITTKFGGMVVIAVFKKEN